MPTIDREIHRFQDFLAHQGQKLTRERTALVREIFGTHYHFEADELLFKMKQKSKDLAGHRLPYAGAAGEVGPGPPRSPR